MYRMRTLVVSVIVVLMAGIVTAQVCEVEIFSDGFESGDTSAWGAEPPSFDFLALADRLCQGDPQLSPIYTTPELMVFVDANDPNELFEWRVVGKGVNLEIDGIQPYVCNLRMQTLILDGQSPQLPHGHFLAWCGWVTEEGDIIWAYRV